MNEVSSIKTSSYDSETWGWVPAISLVCACGLLSVAAADALSRQGSTWADTLFWVGLVVLVMPLALRLISINASRRERIALLVLLGLMLYLVKVMHSPHGFEFADEYVHQYNAMQILQKGALFSANPIIGTTPFYPGLAIVTSALVSLSGLSVFAAGLIVIGLARMILMLSLYLFYEQIGGSARSAGIAAMLYASNSNFLFWSAQFSYESLALPVALMILFIIARRDAANDPSDRRSFTLIALLGLMAIVGFHHLSSYFVALFLVIWTLSMVFNPPTIQNWFKRKLLRRADWESDPVLPGDSKEPRVNGPGLNLDLGPGGLALIAILLPIIWLSYFANNTLGYIIPIFQNAYLSLFNIVNGAEAPRTLFHSTAGYVAPLWQRITGLGAVLLLAAGVPFGLRAFWRQYQKNRVVLILVLMGLAYFGALLLRFAPGAWEIGNRSSEYLFVGLAFLLSIGGLELISPKRALWLGKTGFTISMCIIFMGGVISGWPPRLILQQPSQVNVGAVVVEPQGIAIARWFLSEFGSSNRIGTDPSNARLLLAYGDQFAFEGRYPDVRDIIDTPDFPDWQKQVLQDFSIRYIVLDRRIISRDNMAGYFFDQTGGSQTLNSQWIDQKAYSKFDGIEGLNRILDSGNISIYDLIRLLGKR